MSILVGRNTRLLVQGITGREGGFHTQQMMRYGTNVVAGVTPGKGGTTYEGVPVFDTVAAAKEATHADTSVIFVPPSFAAEAILEAAEAGIGLIICITEGIPILDMVEAVQAVRRAGATLIGPNCPGVMTPGEALVGILPSSIFRPGPVGLVSRSGTLTYEVVNELTARGLGQSSCVGIGGDPMIGTRFVEVLQMFEADAQTEVVIMIGEIGGTDEEEAAAYIKTMKTPVVGFISGRTAPPGKRMGHAGAIISGNMGTAESKVQALEEAKVPVADTINDIVDIVERMLQ